MSQIVLNEPEVNVIETPLRTDRTVEVVSFAYTNPGFEIIVNSAIGNAAVAFPSIVGFRVLDEVDLTEFWSKCSLKDGWVFEVLQGGWKELELKRPHFVSGLQYKLREFLVIGFDTCVSVLSDEAPRVYLQERPN